MGRIICRDIVLKWLSATVVMLFVLNCYATNRYVVYFEFGFFKISGEQDAGLRKWFEEVDWLKVDSITFFGFSDTTGNFWYNRSLAEKRAQFVAGKVASINSQTPLKVIGVGEWIGPSDLARKVEIRIYYTPEIDLDQKVDSDIENPNVVKISAGFCGRPATEFLQKCKMFMAPSKDEPKIRLEIDASDLHLVEALHTGKYVDGSVIWEPLNFVASNRAKELIATYFCIISAEDYRKIGIFYLTKGPCTDCSISVKQLRNNSFQFNLFPDSLIINNMQFLYGRRNNRIRVPGNMIIENEQYFFGCSGGLVNWKQGKLLNRNYKMARMSTEGSSTIAKKIMSCDSMTVPNMCASFAAGANFRFVGEGRGLGIKTGVDYHQGLYTPHLLLAWYCSKISRPNFWFIGLGADINKQLCAEVRFNYDFREMLNNTLIFPYLGTDIQLKYGKPNGCQIIQNVNLGVGYVPGITWIERIFTQVNYGIAYWNRKEMLFSAQAGVVFVRWK